MAEPKPLASLSSSLLARKGHARPAMRPQGFAGFANPMGGAQDDLGWNDMGHEMPRPMAFHADAHGDLPVPPVVRQRAELAGEFGAVEEVPQEMVLDMDLPHPVVAFEAAQPPESDPAVEIHSEFVPDPEAFAPPRPIPSIAVARAKKAAKGRKTKAAFTLRLDPDRHLKLRLACAVGRVSAQAIVTEALDRYLGGMPEIDELVGKVPVSS